VVARWPFGVYNVFSVVYNISLGLAASLGTVICIGISHLLLCVVLFHGDLLKLCGIIFV
jgi:hypothetical protein